ncbi:MAG: DUF2157 domain-containing protein [candidate division FCPU426 bacterium]
MPSQSPKPVPKTGLADIVADWLWVKLREWVEQGIIRPDQKQAIEDLYIWPPRLIKQTPAKPVNLILALEIIGALLIGIGLMTFIAFNWPHLPSPVKLGLVLFLIAAIHLTAYGLVYHSRYHLAGQAVAFLGNLTYGGGIWLVAQIYHLPASFPKGMLIWAAGVLPMALVFKSKLSFFLSVGLFLAWTLALSMGYQLPQPVFLAVLLGLLVPGAYYLRSRIGLAVCLAVGGLWLYLNLFLWADLRVSAFLLVPLALYGLVLLVVSNVHAGKARLQSYAPVYRLVGAVILAALIVSQPFYGIWSVQHARMELAALPWAFWLWCGLLLAGGIILVFIPRWKADDPSSRLTRAWLPYLAAASLYWLALPLIKISVLPSLLGMSAAVLGHWLATRSRSLIQAAIVISLAWLGSLNLEWELTWWFMALLILCGAALYLYGWDLRRPPAKELGLVFQLLGLCLSLGPLFLLTFHSINQKILVAILPLPVHPDYWILAGLLGAAWLAGCRLIFAYAHPKAPHGLLAEERVLAVLLGLSPFAVTAARYAGPPDNWFTFALNAAFFFVSVMFLITGYRRREPHLKALGFGLISLLVAFRFFEMDWSLLYKSILLVFSGIIIMATGILFEKNKEKVAVLD